MSKRYFAYLRKSSESEERQALSIPAQRTWIEEVRKKRGIAIVDVFEESKSAKRPGRAEFGTMLKRLESGEAEGVISWHLNRLARNPVDGGQIMYMLGTGSIGDIITAERVYTGSGDDKLLMSIIFGMATKYVDDLAKDVRRGNREALERGRWIGRPPFGYMRDLESKEIVPDPERFHLVRQVWLDLIAGRPVAEILAELNDVHAFRTPIYGKHGGKPMARSQIYKVLRNHFYMGTMVRKGVHYPGNHKPMITEQQFEEAQAVLDGRLRPVQVSTKRSFPYRGLLLCGACKAKVTARNLVKNDRRRYVYYHCCRKVSGRKRYCPEPSVEQAVIEEQFAAFLGSIVPPENWLAQVDLVIDKVEAETQQVAREARRRRQCALEQLGHRMARVRRLVIDGVISEEDFREEYNALIDEKIALSSTQADAGDRECIEPMADAITLLKQAKFQLPRANDDEKRALLKSLVWYAELKGKTLLIKAKEPFATMAEWSSCPGLSEWLDKVRTLAIRMVGGEAFDLGPIPKRDKFAWRNLPEDDLDGDSDEETSSERN